jgi:hypothetical protein
MQSLQVVVHLELELLGLLPGEFLRCVSRQTHASRELRTWLVKWPFLAVWL